MTTPKTVCVLQSIMEAHALTQQDLADATGQSRASVGHHLTETRPIRDEHLGGYLSAIPKADRGRFFSAWLHDVLAEHPAHLRALLESGGRLKEPVTNWSPELSGAHREALEYWDMVLRNDDKNASSTFDVMTRLQRGQ